MNIGINKDWKCETIAGTEKLHSSILKISKKIRMNCAVLQMSELKL